MPQGGALPGIESPPDGDVGEVLVWAQGVQARAAAAAADPCQDERVRCVGVVAQQLAKLKGPGADSEKAVKALLLYRGARLALEADDPPDEPAAVARWAMARLAGVLYHAATDDPLDVDRLTHRAKALATCGLLLPAKQIAALADELHREHG